MENIKRVLRLKAKELKGGPHFVEDNEVIEALNMDCPDKRFPVAVAGYYGRLTNCPVPAGRVNDAQIADELELLIHSI